MKSVVQSQAISLCSTHAGTSTMQMRSNMQVPVAGQAPRHQGIKHPANPGTKSASRHPEQHHKQHPHGQTAYRNDPLLLFRPPLRQEQELEPAACTPPAASLSRPRLAASQFIISTYCMYSIHCDVSTECQPVLPVFSLSAHYRPSRPSLQSTFICSFLLFPTVLVALRRLPSRFPRRCQRNFDVKRLCNLAT